MELAYQLWPTSHAAPSAQRAKIVLLHGMGGTGALWRPIAASMEDHFQLMALDQRGHGKSRPAPISGQHTASQANYTPLDYGKDVIDTLAAQTFHPAWLIGHSMGVRTACAAAHLKPEWVEGLVLIDLGFFGPAGGGLGEGLASFLEKLPTDFESREEARRFMSENCPDPSIAQYLMAVSTRATDGKIAFPFDHSALIATIRAAQDFSVRDWARELGQRGMPILVLRGAQSLVWSHEEFEEERARFRDLPSIVFREFEGAGHGLPFEQRVRFVSEVAAFIEAHRRS